MVYKICTAQNESRIRSVSKFESVKAAQNKVECHKSVGAGLA